MKAATRHTYLSVKLALGLVAAALIAWLVLVERFVINQSASLPHWLFAQIRLDPGRGDLAVFMPPPTARYQCPFIKRIAGLPGDRIEQQGDCFRISAPSGENRNLGCAKSATETGRLLIAAQGGLIPPGYFWVHADHRDSYDSRYAEIGLIPKGNILGRAIALGGDQKPGWVSWVESRLSDPQAPAPCQPQPYLAAHQGGAP